jgi:transmembrane sensor
MVHEKIIYILIEDETFRRFVLKGDFSENWNQWLVDNPQKEGDFKLASMIIRNLHEENGQIIEDFEKKDIKNKIKQSLANKIDEPKISRAPIFWKAVAALLLLLVSVPIVLHYIENLSLHDKELVIDAQKVIKQNPPGVRSLLTFSDGSKVHLNSGSTLIYPNTFSDNKREVELIGEAYFEINRDENRPFMIQARGLEIHVLGTSFNVNAYPENLFVDIALVSGKVSINTWNGENVVLSPAQMLKYSFAGEKSFRITPFVSDDIIGWKDGILSFREESIRDIFKKLERWYVVDIVYDEKNPVFSDWVFTGKFTNRSLEYILNTINHQELFRFAIDKDKVVIKN